MVNEAVMKCLEAKSFQDRITIHEETIDTVEHAAMRIGCTEAEIAKTLTFLVDEKTAHSSIFHCLCLIAPFRYF